MQYHTNDYYPDVELGSDSDSPTPTPKKQRRGIPTGWFLSILCLVAALSVLITYTATAASKRAYYTRELQAQQVLLQAQQQQIKQLQEAAKQSNTEFAQVQLLSDIFEQYAYYFGEVSEEELLVSVLKAYAAATGDPYAEYYTEEEYAAITAENTGDSEGIGVSVVQTTLTVEGVEYQVFQVIAIYEGSPAAGSTLRVGDMIYAVEVEGEMRTVNQIGYTEAIANVKGPKGTTTHFLAFRPSGESVSSEEFFIVRDHFEMRSVSHFVTEADATVGVVRIAQFDLTTPSQLKAAVAALQASGVERFVFDVRNNPGGDLQSIKAVMTYFLEEGDLILSSIDRNGAAVKSYVAEATELTGNYATCSVLREEIGMFADLDMVVLCNENTASAAEVFTATMRDYGLAPIVGETTYGKGVMQSFLALSWFGDYSGYFKMTTYAYVTACGITYHDIGVSPDEGLAVTLSEEAQQYHFYLLPEALDNQLATAIAAFR